MLAPFDTTARPPVRQLKGRLQASLFAIVGRVSTLRPFGIRPHESAMQFAQRGKLACICMPPRVNRASPDRRQVCRLCGLEVRMVSRQVDRQLTTREIQAVVRALRIAGVQCAALDIPPTITTLRQLNAYLASDAVKLPRSASQEGSQSVASQAH